MERGVLTRYARAGEARIAYQVVGDGPLGLVYARGPASHVEIAWEHPPAARGLRPRAWAGDQNHRRRLPGRFRRARPGRPLRRGDP